MKVFQVLLGTAVIALAGCASDPDKHFGEEMMRLTPIEPPTFLNPDVAGLFGTASFSARIEVQKGLVGSRPPMMGELSGRDGSLFFIADEQQNTRGMGGGLSALWDGSTQTAYLLNEPLQGYAPIRHSDTNGPTEIAVAGEENVGSEHCRKTIISRNIGAGLTPVVIVWRGLAQQDLPLRIQTTNAPEAVTLTLSRVRFHAPPPELFALPNGFKKYESTDAMMAELVRRRTDALSARAKARRDRYGSSRSDEDEPRAFQAPTRPY